MDYTLPQSTFLHYHIQTNDDKIFIGDKKYSFGEIITEVLNVDTNEIISLVDLTDSIYVCLDEINKCKNPIPGFKKLSKILIELAERLHKIPPYSYFNIDLGFEINELKQIGALKFQTALDHGDKRFLDTLVQVCDTFIGIPQEIKLFIDSTKVACNDYLSRVDKRNAENYAKQILLFEKNETGFSKLVNGHSIKNKDVLNPLGRMLYGVSCVKDNTDEEKTIIVDTLVFDSAKAFLEYDFLKALQHGYAPVRCKNCDRYFLSTDSYNKLYCNGKAPQNLSLTCRNVGAKNRWKEKVSENPIKGTYDKAMNKFNQQYKRNRISLEDYTRIKRYLQQVRDNTTRGKDSDGELLTYHIMEQLFDTKKVYETLNIKVKK